jgi:hypothetical protein
LARKETAHSRQQRGTSGRPEPLPAARQAYESLQPLYKDLLRDYFLAVVLRRKVTHRSVSFHRTVYGTQCVMLASIVVLFWIVGDRAVRSRLVRPEQQTVQAWLDGRYENVKLKGVEILSREPTCVRARFHYYVNGRKIESQQLLTLDGDRVVSLGGDE